MASTPRGQRPPHRDPLHPGHASICILNHTTRASPPPHPQRLHLPFRSLAPAPRPKQHGQTVPAQALQALPRQGAAGFLASRLGSGPPPTQRRLSPPAPPPSSRMVCVASGRLPQARDFRCRPAPPSVRIRLTAARAGVKRPSAVSQEVAPRPPRRPIRFHLFPVSATHRPQRGDEEKQPGAELCYGRSEPERGPVLPPPQGRRPVAFTACPPATRRALTRRAVAVTHPSQYPLGPFAGSGWLGTAVLRYAEVSLCAPPRASVMAFRAKPLMGHGPRPGASAGPPEPAPTQANSSGSRGPAQAAVARATRPEDSESESGAIANLWAVIGAGGTAAPAVLHPARWWIQACTPHDLNFFLYQNSLFLYINLGFRV